jgi:hypothetical protein
MAHAARYAIHVRVQSNTRTHKTPYSVNVSTDQESHNPQHLHTNISTAIEQHEIDPSQRKDKGTASP